MQVERIYDYISHPHVSAGGAGWGSLYSYTTYAVLDNSTSCAWLTCYCAMLLRASGRLLRAPGFRCVAWRRRVQGFECRAFTNCFVLGFVSRVHVHSRVSPGAWARAGFPLSVPRLLLTRLLKGQSLHAVFPTVCRLTWDCLSYHLYHLLVSSCSWSQLNLHSVSGRPLRKILFPSPREHQPEKTHGFLAFLSAEDPCALSWIRRYIIAAGAGALPHTCNHNAYHTWTSLCDTRSCA